MIKHSSGDSLSDFGGAMPLELDEKLTLDAIIMEGQVLDNRQVAKDTFLMRIQAPEIAKKASPGRFVKIRSWSSFEKSSGPLLDRPFSIHNVDAQSIHLLYRVVGQATALMSQCREGSIVKLTGPLGQGLDEDFGKKSKGIYLVAGGMGLAPMAFVFNKFQKFCRISLFYGERVGELQVDEAYLKSWAGDYTAVCQDKAIYGQIALVTTALEVALKSEIRPIFACGPPKMLEAVCHLGEKYQTEVKLSVEAGMACGLGVCLTCSLALKNGERIRVCQEGPVVDGNSIDWAGVQ